MKSLFMDTLPAEVRILIYRELLRDVEHVLKPQGKREEDDIPKKSLYPAILGVCKNIYAEASAILYEENEFSYEYSSIRTQEDTKSLFIVGTPSRGAFERIKKLQICYMNDEDFNKRKISRKYMVLVEHVANLGCHLKKLHLRFWFFGISRGSAAVIARSKRSQSLSKTLANLDVEKEIQVNLESDLVSDCEMFVAFANEIGLLKGWALTVEKLIAIPSKDYYSSDDSTDEEQSDGEVVDGEVEDHNADGLPSASDQNSNTQEQDNPEEGLEKDSAVDEIYDYYNSVYLDYEKEHDDWVRAHYIWMWTLRPATAITMTEVPTASRY